MNETNGKKEMSIRFLFGFCSILLAVLVSVGGFLFCQYVDLSIKITRLEGSCVLSKDLAIIYGEIAKTQRDFAGLPKEYPPAWFVQRVTKLEEQISRCEDKLRK